MLPDDAQVVQDHVEILFQPDPRFKKTVKCQARIENTIDGSGKSYNVIMAQVKIVFIEFLLHFFKHEKRSSSSMTF